VDGFGLLADLLLGWGHRSAASITYALSPSGVTTETPPLPYAILSGTNGDGSLIVESDGDGAFRWTEAGGTQSLGIPESRATDVSSDGTRSQAFLASGAGSGIGRPAAWRWYLDESR
jgi:hypothetical protein